MRIFRKSGRSKEIFEGFLGVENHKDQLAEVRKGVGNQGLIKEVDDGKNVRRKGEVSHRRSCDKMPAPPEPGSREAQVL